MKFVSYITLISALMAHLASAADGTEAMEPELNLVTLLSKGGYTMIALGVLSVFTLILIFLYLLTMRRSRIVTGKFMNAAEAMIKKRDYLGLVAFCHRRNEAVARVTQKTLDFLTNHPGADSSDLREVAEAEGARQGGVLTQRISYLADIGGIAPMIGLLGTVIGMIKSFMEIGSGNFEGVKQLQLAEGVWEALITTAVGLVISIFAMTFYSFFRGKVLRHIAELEAAATHILALVGGQIDPEKGDDKNSQLNREDYLATLPPSAMRG